LLSIDPEFTARGLRRRVYAAQDRELVERPVEPRVSPIPVSSTGQAAHRVRGTINTPPSDAVS
jgi:hypothetical protein